MCAARCRPNFMSLKCGSYLAEPQEVANDLAFCRQNAPFAQTPSFFAQRSTYARSRTSPRIPGISDWVIAAFEMEGNTTFFYNCCLSLVTANATDGRQFPRQAVTDWRSSNLFHATFSSSWHADSTRAARSGSTSVTGSNPSDWLSPGRNQKHKFKTMQGGRLYNLYTDTDLGAAQTRQHRRGAMLVGMDVILRYYYPLFSISVHWHASPKLRNESTVLGCLETNWITDVDVL